MDLIFNLNCMFKCLNGLCPVYRLRSCRPLVFPSTCPTSSSVSTHSGTSLSPSSWLLKSTHHPPHPTPKTHTAWWCLTAARWTLGWKEETLIRLITTHLKAFMHYVWVVGLTIVVCKYFYKQWGSGHLQVVSMTLVSMGNVGIGSVSDRGFHRVPYRRGSRHWGLWTQAGRCRQEPCPVGPQHHSGQDTHTTRQVETHTHLGLLVWLTKLAFQ